MASLLRKLITGQERTKLLLIEDDSPDVNITLPFTINLINSDRSPCLIDGPQPSRSSALIINELRPHQIRPHVKQSNELTIIDLVGDLKDSSTESIRKRIESLEDNSLIIIDSLSYLIYTLKIGSLIQCLQILEAKNSSVICFLHRHCHPEHIFAQLESLATAILRISHDNLHSCLVARCLFKKRDARRGLLIKESKEYFNVGNDLAIDVVDRSKLTENAVPEELPASSGPLPEDMDLPFKLSLKPSERQAKDNMTLPFQKTKESKVFYVPGKEDDIDEDDPDDDLDF